MSLVGQTQPINDVRDGGSFSGKQPSQPFRTMVRVM
jgi:hypothetical protein